LLFSKDKIEEAGNNIKKLTSKEFLLDIADKEDVFLGCVDQKR